MWILTWDISRSTIKVQEGKDGDCWEENVGKFPENLQEIIAEGGLTEWVKHEIAKVAVLIDDLYARAAACLDILNP
ncbi:hypothetical protein NUW58_g3096 [Xylaria curta]|uniref:Uncharacterized protein n=1 Tax=Xylaria curta TaxID=42375 RepID=A0ACC1PCH8_9PEZI|nr:hypothetical protein NUW58_g3096 [Xylaria curta]